MCDQINCSVCIHHVTEEVHHRTILFFDIPAHPLFTLMSTLIGLFNFSVSIKALPHFHSSWILLVVRLGEVLAIVMSKDWDPKFPDGPPADFDPNNPFKDRLALIEMREYGVRKKAVEIEKAKVPMMDLMSPGD